MTLAHAPYGDHRTAQARLTDPDTSRAAAASVTELSAAQARILAIFHARGDMTDGDLIAVYQHMVDEGQYPPLSVSGIRTRRSELFRDGRIIDTGERGLTVAGRATILWGSR